jgi:two-component system, cell cycle sensor histidine kinase and response regulator CckA
MHPSTDTNAFARSRAKRKPTGRDDFQLALLELAKSHLADFTEGLRGILQKDAEAMRVERVSAWFFDAEYTEMTCRELFQLDKGFQEPGIVLKAAKYPRYFRAMREQRVIAAMDARRDPQTSEFTKGYLEPLGITAMLDVPIWHGGRMVGVVCHEHTGGHREWTIEEQDFAASIADMISRAIVAGERTSAEHLKAAIIEAALDCIVIMDDEGRICEFNPAAEQAFGFKREEILGKQLVETIIPHHYRDAHTAGLKRFLSTGEARVMGRRVELSALRADGTCFPCELTITLTKADRRPLFTAYLRDISARVRAERRQSAQLAVTRVLAEAATLAEAASQILRAVCESLDWDLGVIWRAEGDKLSCVEIWQADGRDFTDFVAVTRQKQFALGEGLPGRIWSAGAPTWLPNLAKDRNLPRAKAAARCGIKSAFGFPVRIGTNVLGVIEFFSREIREVDAELLAIFAAIGAQVGLFIERRRAEEDLRTLNADLERRVAVRTKELAEANSRIQEALEHEQELGMLKSNFITTVTHEFRTPLGVILSSAEMLQMYFDRLAAKERNEQLQTISDAVQRMAGLMEEVLLFHKVEGGVSELNAEVHDLASLCRQIANEVVSATAHRCEIDCKIPTLPQARFDERLFRHILVNLLNNAIKYSEPGCSVTLAVKRAGRDVVVSVKDRGIGMSEEDMKRLFVPFRRGGNVGQRAGTGLGLSIAKRCVDLHGGRLEFQSKVGEGTTATLRLPVFTKS